MIPFYDLRLQSAPPWTGPNMEPVLLRIVSFAVDRTPCSGSAIRPCDKHFVDPVTVHVNNFIHQSAGFEIISGFWYPSENIENTAGDGPVLPFLLLCKGPGRQHIPEIFNGGIPVDQP